MKKYAGHMHVTPGLVAQDLSVGGGNKAGDWVDMSLYDSLTVLYTSAAGTAGQDVTCQLRQAKTSAAGSVKNLDAGQWYAMQHATALTDELAEVGTPGVFTDDGETQCVARVEITSDQLDEDNDFRWVQLRCTDSGGTAGKFAAAVYVQMGGRYIRKPDDQPSSL